MDDKPANAKEILQQMRDNLQATVEMQASLALIMKARFDALTKVGFSDDQAIFLCKL